MSPSDSARESGNVETLSSQLDLMLLIAHEVRAPLGIVKESISLVTDKILGKTNEKQQQVLLTARRNVDRIDRLIMNVLDLFKLEAGRLELQKLPFDLMTVVRQVTALYQPQAEASGLQFKVVSSSETLPVTADKARISNVLAQIVGNAIKFTEKGGIEVKLEKNNGAIECSVKDTGIGIAPENMGRLFKKYEQFGWVPGGGEKGMGIGLAVAKGILSLHGGTLSARSRLGGGSVFTFVLPAGTA